MLAKQLDGRVDERKLNEVQSILGKFISGFCGVLSHSEDLTNIDEAMRRNSASARGVTKTCLQFISTAIEEEIGAHTEP